MSYPQSGPPDPNQSPYGAQPGYGGYEGQPGYGAQPGYGGYPQPGYPVQPVPYPVGYPSAPGTNVMAILSLVFAFIFSPLAIVFGHIAKKQISQSGEQGEGLATAGLVLGYIFTGLSALACCGYLVVIVAAIGNS